MIVVLLSAALFLAALTFVLMPLFGESPSPAISRPAMRPDDGARERAIGSLREIEFDRATGKLSDDDYDALKEKYTAEAVAVMRSEASSAPTTAASVQSPLPGPPEDEIERMIHHYRSSQRACRHCGPRPEIDAVYCSACGRYLAGRCGSCGVAIDEVGARFCVACGRSLAA